MGGEGGEGVGPMKLGVAAAGNASWTGKNLAEGRSRQLITTMDQKYIRASGARRKRAFTGLTMTVKVLPLNVMSIYGYVANCSHSGDTDVTEGEDKYVSTFRKRPIRSGYLSLFKSAQLVPPPASLTTSIKPSSPSPPPTIPSYNWE